jgi:hypothetical protein
MLPFKCHSQQLRALQGCNAVLQPSKRAATTDREQCAEDYSYCPAHFLGSCPALSLFVLTM